MCVNCVNELVLVFLTWYIRQAVLDVLFFLRHKFTVPQIQLGGCWSTNWMLCLSWVWKCNDLNYYYLFLLFNDYHVLLYIIIVTITLLSLLSVRVSIIKTLFCGKIHIFFRPTTLQCDSLMWLNWECSGGEVPTK